MFRKMASNSEEIGKSLRCVLDKIQKATEVRPKSLPKFNPRLVAVSKTKPVTDVIAAYSVGQRHFGENYVNELEEKSRNEVILEQCGDIKWHFIGHLQRNKASKIALIPNLYMVETLDSQKLAQTLNNIWEKYKRPGKLKVMVQVNTSGEENKSGVSLDMVNHLSKFVCEKCPCLHFSGLMTIGAFGYNPDDGPNPDFMTLVKCREELCQALGMKIEDVELSMGMSSDYEHAIHLGSSNVRVGSTIFGARANAIKPQNQENTNSNLAMGAGVTGTSVDPNQTSNQTSSQSVDTSSVGVSASDGQGAPPSAGNSEPGNSAANGTASLQQNLQQNSETTTVDVTDLLNDLNVK